MNLRPINISLLIISITTVDPPVFWNFGKFVKDRHFSMKFENILSSIFPSSNNGVFHGIVYLWGLKNIEQLKIEIYNK